MQFYNKICLSDILTAFDEAQQAEGQLLIQKHQSLLGK